MREKWKCTYFEIYMVEVEGVEISWDWNNWLFYLGDAHSESYELLRSETYAREKKGIYFFMVWADFIVPTKIFLVFWIR